MVSLILNYAILALGFVSLIMGLIEACTGKVIGSAKKVAGMSAETVKKYARINGITNIICGIIIIAVKLLALTGKVSEGVGTYGILIALVPAVIGELLKNKLKAEKK